MKPPSQFLTWLTTFGRCTLTATSTPSRVLALYTCPIEAEAMGPIMTSKSEKVLRSGPKFSSRITRACDEGNGGTLS